MIVYLNGEFLPAETARISVLDGGYLYGDGVFETLRIYRGRVFDLPGHLERMALQLERLQFDWRPDRDRFSRIVDELLIHNALRDRDARCRLTVSRGVQIDEPLPLARFRDLAPTVSGIVQPLGEELADWRKRGVAVLSMPATFRRGNFPHLKTLNYLPTVMALRAARAADCVEALLTDDAGCILEGATSNVFMWDGQQLSTPPLALGLLPGRTREMVMSQAEQAGLSVIERPFTLAELAAAPEVLLSGSVKEVLAVVRLDGAVIGDGVPGGVFRTLQNAYRRGVQATLGDHAASGD